MQYIKQVGNISWKEKDGDLIGEIGGIKFTLSDDNWVDEFFLTKKELLTLNKDENLSLYLKCKEIDVEASTKLDDKEATIKYWEDFKSAMQEYKATLA